MSDTRYDQPGIRPAYVPGVTGYEPRMPYAETPAAAPPVPAARTGAGMIALLVIAVFVVIGVLFAVVDPFSPATPTIAPAAVAPAVQPVAPATGG